MIQTAEYERRVEASAAFDKRHPEPSKNYGVHGVEFRFSLIGEKAAASFSLSTGWLLPSTVGVEERAIHLYRPALAAYSLTSLHPMPAGLHYHVADPISAYMAETEPGPCDLLPGGKCYGDVTYTGADRPFFALVEGGLDGLWESLAAELAAFVGDRTLA